MLIWVCLFLSIDHSVCHRHIHFTMLMFVLDLFFSNLLFTISYTIEHLLICSDTWARCELWIFILIFMIFNWKNTTTTYIAADHNTTNSQPIIIWPIVYLFFKKLNISLWKWKEFTSFHSITFHLKIPKSLVPYPWISCCSIHFIIIILYALFFLCIAYFLLLFSPLSYSFLTLHDKKCSCIFKYFFKFIAVVFVMLKCTCKRSMFKV